MATVHEKKNQMTFTMKVLRQFKWNFLFSIYMMVIQDLAKTGDDLKFNMALMPTYGKTIQTTSSP